MQIDSDQTVDALRLKIEELEGIPPDFQRLIFAGKELQNNTLLVAYNIGMFHAPLKF